MTRELNLGSLKLQLKPLCETLHQITPILISLEELVQRLHHYGAWQFAVPLTRAWRHLAHLGNLLVLTGMFGNCTLGVLFRI